MERYTIIAIAAYLLGNVQFAIILSKWKYHDDVRKHGSGNAGSTNMLRVFGLKPGLLTFAGDFCKGVLAVLLGRLVAGERGSYVAALFVVLGHDFPVFLQFKGGKGVASNLRHCLVAYSSFWDGADCLCRNNDILNQDYCYRIFIRSYALFNSCSNFLLEKYRVADIDCFTCCARLCSAYR